MPTVQVSPAVTLHTSLLYPGENNGFAPSSKNIAQINEGTYFLHGWTSSYTPVAAAYEAMAGAHLMMSWLW